MTKKVLPKLVNKQAELVKEFNDTFCPDAGSLIYQKLIREEFNELVDEIESKKSVENELKELMDLLYVVYGMGYVTGCPIAKNHKEIDEIIDSVNKHKDKYPNINLPLTIIATAYVELITSNYDFMWLYRLAQGCYAYAKVRGWSTDQAFKRVHDSNMSKLENGKVLRREDGKVLKGKDYKPANLKDLVDGTVENKQKGTKGSTDKQPVRRTRQ